MRLCLKYIALCKVVTVPNNRLVQAIKVEKNNESGKESNYVSPYIIRFLSEDKIQIRGPRTFDFKTGEILPKMRSTNFENDDYSNDGDDITSLIRQ